MASAEYQVLTPERVSIQYGIAGIGSRGAAVIIDTAIQFVALLVLFIALSLGIAFTYGFTGVTNNETRGLLIFGAYALSAFLISNGYFILFEIVWSGQTPGKRILGLRVLRESGYPIRPIDSVIRNLVRMVDWLPLAYGLGVLVMLTNSRSKRLGDFACGTIVVREGARRPVTLFTESATTSAVLPPSHSAQTAIGMLQPQSRATQTGTGAPPSASDAVQVAINGTPSVSEAVQAVTGTAQSASGALLSSADATLVRDFLVRRAQLHLDARVSLARRLANLISRRYHLPLEPDGDAESFLERLSL